MGTGGDSEDAPDVSPEDAPVRRVGSDLDAPDAPRVRNTVPPASQPRIVAVTPPPKPRISASPRPEVMFGSSAAPTQPSVLTTPINTETELPASIVPPTWRPADFGRPALQTVDAPVAQDLFREGGFEELDRVAAPTDEPPSQVMEDVGQPYTTPYSVPEPPPIPGIVDRFTPPPAQRTEIGSRRKKPDLTDSGAARDFRPTPAPARRDERATVAKTIPSPRLAVEPIPEPPPPSRGMMWLGIFGILFGLTGTGFGAAGAVLFYLSKHPKEDEEPKRPKIPQAEVIPKGKELELEPAPAPAPQDGTKPAPAAAPVEPPAPDPKAKAPAPAPAATAAKATIKIRSNRRVLVYVNGEVKGYSPQVLPADPGKTYSILAVMPGQPNTKQARDATPKEAGQTVIVDFSF